MGSADAAAAATVEGPTAAAATAAAAPGEAPATPPAQEDGFILLGEERPFGNVPSWDSSGRDAESSNCSGNGAPPYTLSIAPMMEWTDRHYRFMVRGITRHTQLYTEMVVDSTLLHQRRNLDVFLGHDPAEHPIAVQLGGFDPEDVGEAAAICEQFGGFNEINLNVGCPSPRVSGRCFGARLMLEPERVGAIVRAMQRRATATPITVKCRIGADDKDSYEDLTDFVRTVSDAGVRHLVVHARKCLLKGLTPTQNRSVPPLRYPVVHSLVRDFPEMTIALNGGVTSFAQAQRHLSLEDCEQEGWGLPVHGVMIGRTAYNHPWSFRHADSTFFGREDPGLTRRAVVERYLDYGVAMLERYRDVPNGGSSLGSIVKPLHNLFSGEPRGKFFRRRLSEIHAENRKLRHKEENGFIVPADGGAAHFVDMVTQALEEAVPSEIMDALD